MVSSCVVATVQLGVALAAIADGTSSSGTCFGVRADGHVYTAEGCCDVERHGPGGDPRCWGFDPEIQAEASFARCCVGELLGRRLLADRPPLLLDLLLQMHPRPAELWAQARDLCAKQHGCTEAEVAFSGIQLSSEGRFLPQSHQRLARALIDVGAHVQSQYLERLAKEPETLLIALEPDRASLRYQRAFASRSLDVDTLSRFWLLPAAVGLTLGLATLRRANRFYDGQCSSLLDVVEDAVAWAGCTEVTGRDIVSTLPLAEILARLPAGIEDIEVKLDVQGFELQALLSAGDQLARVSRLKIELQDVDPGDPRVRYRGQHTKAEVVEALRLRGFELKSCEPYNGASEFIRETDCHFARSASEENLRPTTVPLPALGVAPLYRPRVHLVTYADGQQFKEVQSLLGDSAKIAGFESHWAWGVEELLRRASGSDSEQNPLHSATATAREMNEGGFLSFSWRWWKPFVTLLALKAVAPGDWVVYQDSTSYTPEGFRPEHAGLLGSFLHRLEADGAHAALGLVLRQSIGWEWAQRCIPNYSAPPRLVTTMDEEAMASELCAVLVRIGICQGGAREDAAEGDCCEGFQEHPMLQNAWGAWRNEPRSHKLLAEWLSWNVDERVMQFMPFADQSLFQILVHKTLGGATATMEKGGIGVLVQEREDECKPWVLTPEKLQHLHKRESPQNRWKHLGLALEALEDRKLGLRSLQEVGLAAWREGGGTGREPWLSSLCLEDYVATSSEVAAEAAPEAQL